MSKNKSVFFYSNQKFGLYIHIPFCRIKCKYCDFSVFPGLLNTTDAYLKSLKQEMHIYNGALIDTIFIGGGTPSLLSKTQWDFLFFCIQQHFVIQKNTEISVECNPEDINKQLLQTFKKHKINRISIGFQSCQDDILKYYGRIHTHQQSIQAFQLCRQYQFNNINIDLIYGASQESLEDVQKTINVVLQLNPEHISIYGLTVNENSTFGKQKIYENEDIQSNVYPWIHTRCHQANYNHYEISNFAKDGYQCQHNLKYWNNQNTIGLGISASSYINHVRYKNKNRIYSYMESIKKHTTAVQHASYLSPRQQIGEDMILALRLKTGFIYRPIHTPFKPILKKYVDCNFLSWNHLDQIQATLSGWNFSNNIFSDLL